MELFNRKSELVSKRELIVESVKKFRMRSTSIRLQVKAQKAAVKRRRSELPVRSAYTAVGEVELVQV